VFIGETSSAKRSTAIEIARAVATSVQPRSGGVEATFNLPDASSIADLRRLCQLASRWKSSRISLGGYGISFGVMDDILRGSDTARRPDDTIILRELKCAQAILAALEATGLPERTRHELTTLGLETLRRRDRTHEGVGRALAVVERAAAAAVWVSTSVETGVAGQLGPEVIGCFARFAVSLDRHHYCRGGLGHLAIRERFPEVPFPCRLAYRHLTETSAYVAARPRIDDLRVTASTFPGRCCPAFDVEPTIQDIKRMRSALKKHAEDHDYHSFLAWQLLPLRLRRAAASNPATAEHAKNMIAFNRGEVLRCRACTKTLTSGVLEECAFEGAPTSEGAMDLAASIQARARFTQAVANRTCKSCNSMTLHQACQSCKRSGVVAVPSLLARAISAALPDHSSYGVSASTWIARNLGEFCLAVLGTCEACLLPGLDPRKREGAEG
jgi:hypothetical protein